MLKKSGIAGFIASVLSLPALSQPITVQSVLFDHDQNVLTVGAPFVDPAGNPVQNGDFLITRSGIDLPVGNGVDEWTKGVFDFRGDANYADFSQLLLRPHGKVFAATLTMILTPFSNYQNDQFNLENNQFVGEPEIGEQLLNNPFLANGISKQVTIDLLDYYSINQLENYLSNGTGDFVNDGRIVLTYGDDAIMSGASLRITANVPEPGTLSLLFLGLLPLIVRKFKK